MPECRAPCTPARASEYRQPTQGTPLEHVALVPKGLMFLGPIDLGELERQFSAGHHPQDTAETAG